MIKIIAWSVVSLIIGYFAAVFTGVLDDDSVDSVVFSDPDTDSRLEARLLALESRLAEEVLERQRLQEAMDGLMLDQWLSEGSARDDDNVRPAGRAVIDRGNLSPEERQQQFRARAQERQASVTSRRTGRLEDAGFAPDRVAWILQREEQIRLEGLNSQWEQRRNTFLESGETADNPLREELGELDYERYLAATGRPTSVYVSNLVNDSQATAAGFQSGDEIVRYNGERVYSFNELNQANVQGELGEQVVVDVIRDGAPIQLTVERGPLGIVGGRRRGNRGR